MKIVVLNLADNDEHGLVSSVVRTIHDKYSKTALQRFRNRVFGSNAVTEYNLIPMLSGHGPKLGNAEVSPAFIRDHCTRADRVIVALHGNYDRRDEGTVKMGVGDESAVSVDHLCDLVGTMLAPGGRFELTLLMCYGARTVTYQMHQFVSNVDWSTSFAYRFYDKLVAERDIRMVAFTGAVSVDSNSERFHIQTEMAVLSQVELKEREARAAAARENYLSLLQRSKPGDRDEFEKKFDALTNPDSRETPSADARLRDGYRIVGEYAFFVNLAMDAADKEAGTGKIVFIRRKGKTVVLTHHPTLRFLYPPDLATA